MLGSPEYTTFQKSHNCTHITSAAINSDKHKITLPLPLISYGSAFAWSAVILHFSKIRFFTISLLRLFLEVCILSNGEEACFLANL